MADPRSELADIIVPAAPAIVAADGGLPPEALVLGLAAVAGAALVAWLWLRHRPLRELGRIARAAALRQDALPVLAARLDAWARARYRLARVTPAGCPPGIAPAAWSGWAQALAQLRFAPPQPGGHDALEALCETARTWGHHA